MWCAAVRVSSTATTWAMARVSAMQTCEPPPNGNTSSAGARRGRPPRSATGRSAAGRPTAAGRGARATGTGRPLPRRAGSRCWGACPPPPRSARTATWADTAAAIRAAPLWRAPIAGRHGVGHVRAAGHQHQGPGQRLAHAVVAGEREGHHLVADLVVAEPEPHQLGHDVVAWSLAPLGDGRRHCAAQPSGGPRVGQVGRVRHELGQGEGREEHALDRAPRAALARASSSMAGAPAPNSSSRMLRWASARMDVGSSSSVPGAQLSASRSAFSRARSSTRSASERPKIRWMAIRLRRCTSPALVRSVDGFG